MQESSAALLGDGLSPVRPPSMSPELQHTPRVLCNSPCSAATSPPGPWTSITHNSLYNASPGSTPQKQAGSSPPRVEHAQQSCTADGAGVPTAGGAPEWPAVSPAASPQHALAVQSSVVPAVAEQGLADAQQQGLANVWQQPWLEVQDQVLRNVLGVGLQKVQEGAAEVRLLG